MVCLNCEMLQKIEENDKYMTAKVNQQLDRLIGQGNYIATVSTFLRQALFGYLQQKHEQQELRPLFLNKLLLFLIEQ